MTDGPGEKRESISDAVNGFEKLKPRQIDWNSWEVLSYRNETVTSHRVDVREKTCDCRDQHFNQDGNKICDHLAVVLDAMNVHRTVEEEAVRQLAMDVKRVERMVDDLRQAATGVESSLKTDATDSRSEASDDDHEDLDPIDELLAFFNEELQIDVGGIDVWEHEDYGSLQIETTGDLSNDDFDTFRDWARNTENVVWDPDKSVNYIKSEDVDTVLDELRG